VDWDAVERDYRTGKFTLRELAEKYGPSHQAIAKRAKVHGWTQDLGEQIKQATNARLVAKLVDNEIAKGGQAVANSVLVAAEINTNVILGHRKGLQRITRIKEALLDQIEQAAAQLPELAEAIELVRKPDENGVDKANDALRKAMSRTSLVDDLKKLAEVDERVRKGEREAFDIGAGQATPDDPLTQLLQKISGRVDSAFKPVRED
jgi:predicted DNA-binding protein YlxM (UPF0122 family)